WKGWAILLRQKQKKLIMLPSETMIWQPEFTDKTLSRKPGAVHISIQAHEKKLTENIRTDRALRDAKNKLRELEKELKRKDKALAEAAALLILREKFNALWDNSEED
ncbi:hypothetical protein, partial [Escherichia coli]|uniref:hypothetical protein n=1 Tax=Escherichia coli TaxID=562 RepID=UPI00398EF592